MTQKLPIELDSIALQLGEKVGAWRSCSGCHELNEGVPTGAYSSIMRCHLGLGCHECGGIGAVWDTTDYAAMGDFMAGNTPAPQHISVVAPIVRVKTMRLSDGRADHFVSIKVGDREVHPHVFREEFKAAYHVALYSWLLNGTAEPELMAFNEGEWPAQTTELVGADPVQIELLQEEVARLQDDLDEARQVLWPEWSTKILKLVRSYSGYDGYDDATEGVDLVAEVEEALSELHSEAEKLRKAAPAEHVVGVEAAWQRYTHGGKPSIWGREVFEAGFRAARAPAPSEHVGLRDAAWSLINDLDRSLVGSRDIAVIHATNTSVKRLRLLLEKLDHETPSPVEREVGT